MKYLLTLIFALIFSTSINAATFTVTNANDGGAGSLRQSITDANMNQGTDTIIFNISSGHQIIYPLDPLPEITSPVIIDGTTQHGYNGTPLIEINGSKGTQFGKRGLFITAGSSTVKGLNISLFSGYVGIYLDKLGGNIIEGNFIGTDITGTLRPGYQQIGIYIYHSDNNLIGGTTSAARNIISGNNDAGISIVYSRNNKVSGNFIGTDFTGNQSIYNNTGVSISFESSVNNIIGGVSPEEKNIISGNRGGGVFIATASDNKVVGNYIGLNAAGTAALANASDGVFLSSASNNIIGGLNPWERNVISGNGGGIRLLGCMDNVIQGNYIGTSTNGLTAIPNLTYGIDNYNSVGSIIGGETSVAGNVISGNQSTGVAVGPNLPGNTATKIQNNFIGVASDGISALPNGSSGIGLASTTYDVLIGGGDKSFGNIIAYNNGEGILMGDINHVAIRSNSIFSNSNLGIKYYFGNHKPNFLTQTAEFSGNFINIHQWLILPISGEYTIDYFASEMCDPSGYGEGKYYLGSKVISSPMNNSQAFPEVQFV